ncbi:hypothetical protein EVAR_80114_1 [Eumeta japonica]|uniref:Mariner Mos1 transposase n=1 Tax=Eumeta variegata TaxID=151549 RepID=A0A4C1UCT7_EUMVA|nr:hypothetical protein EVAR_80114_1 [Eumeta japonica]
MLEGIYNISSLPVAARVRSAAPGNTQRQSGVRAAAPAAATAAAPAAAPRRLQEFNLGSSMLTVELKDSPKSVVVPQNIDAELELIVEGIYVTYREIKTSLDVTKHVYTTTTPKQNSNRPYGSIKISVLPTKMACEQSASERMIASFFNKTEHVTTVALENCPLVNSDWYATNCLPKVINELCKNNCKRRIILHRDNASPHTVQQANNFLKEKHVEFMSNSAYSLYLAPCDFLFVKIKNQLPGQ